MKLDRIIWGMLFLFVGGVILLDNLNVIDFYWRNVFQFWPIFLVIIGLNMLVGRKDSNIGGIITIAVVIIALGFLFWKGQQPRVGGWFNGNFRIQRDDSAWSTDRSKYVDMRFEEMMPSPAPKLGKLEYNGGGTSIDLDQDTEKLLEADAKDRNGRLQLDRDFRDSLVVLKFYSKNRNNSWKMGDGTNELDLKLNSGIEWDMKFELGAGSLDMDLTKFMIRNIDFHGGASAMDVKLGDLYANTKVKVKAGVADINLSIPQGSGCRIVTKTGLSSRDFKGFTKISQGVYETQGYNSAANKINIEFEGGLANFNVDRY